MKLQALLEDLVNKSIPLVVVLVLLLAGIVFSLVATVYWFTLVFGYIGWVVLACSVYLVKKIKDRFKGKDI